MKMDIISVWLNTKTNCDFTRFDLNNGQWGLTYFN